MSSSSSSLEEDPFPNYSPRFSPTAEPQPQPQPQPQPRVSGRRFTVKPNESIAQYTSPYLAQQDEDIVTRMIQDCGLHAYGAIFVELWVLSPTGRYMRRSKGGHWMDPQFVRSISPPSLAEEVNEHAQDCAPGVSLAGTLYNETSQWGNRGVNRKVYWRQLKSMSEDPFIQDDGRIKTLTEELGIGFVASIPFDCQGRNGIVLFMSRATCNVDRLRSTANENFLIAATDLIGASFAIRIPRQELSNIRRGVFKSAVTKVMAMITKNRGHHLGSIVVSMESEGMKPTDSFAKKLFRQCSVEPAAAEAQEDEAPQDRNKVPEQWRRPDHFAAEYVRIGWSTISTFTRRTSSIMVNSVRKWEGARMKGPARTSAPDCAIIFILVTLAMLTILRMNDGLENSEAPDGADNNFKWDLNGGWYASTMCIVFALSSAPVGQPRQIIGAHIINALVGLAFQQIPTTPTMLSFSDFAKLGPGERVGIPLFWKESLAVGVGVAAQAWLGVMHPPATGLAFSFAQSDRYQLSNLVVVIIADLMLIALATLLLNLQEKKQYPMFWIGFGWKYPMGKLHDVTNKTRDTTVELTERITRKKGRNKTDRDIHENENTPQDRTTTTTTTTAAGAENV